MEKHLLPEAAAQLFTAILKGLSVHGQYEAVKNPLIMRGLQHYEMMVGTQTTCLRSVFRLCSLLKASLKLLFCDKGPQITNLQEGHENTFP